MSVFITARSALLLGSSGFAAFALALAGPAHAADGSSPVADAETGGGADIVVVTARHREETAQSIPVAVSVVSEQSFEKTGNFTLNQVQQLVPSLQVASFNPRNTNINIRGLGANSSFAVDGLEYGVGFYLDGVYYGRPAQSQFDLVDLQQIEVLHGPQGSLWGKNTTAGAINVTSKEPSFTPEATIEGSLGTYNFHQIRASVSAPLLTDKVAFRLTIADSHRDGYLRNLYDGSGAQDYNNTSLRGQLLIKPAENLKIRLIGDWSKQDQHYALTLLDGYFTTFADGSTIPNNILQRADRVGYALPAYGAFARLGNSNSAFQANMKTWGVSGQVDYDAGPVTLTSITAYRQWDWWPANDGDGTPLSINLKAQQQNFQRQFSQELRIASNGSHFIDYQAGLYYYWQIVRGYGATQYGSDFAAWNFNPAIVPAATIALTNTALTNFEADSYSDPQTKSLAAFGQADLHLAEPLTLTLGLRYTHEDKKGSFSRWQVDGSGLDLSGLSSAELATVMAIRNNSANQVSDLSFSAADKSNALTGLATLSYKPVRDVLLYATYSRGNKSGGLNLTAGGILEPVVKPEIVDAFEIGLKSRLLDNTVTANFAAFLTNVRDYQANVSVLSTNGAAAVQYIANIPKVRSQGIEADLAYQPSKWVSLTASFAYTDAKYVRYVNAPNSPENNPASNPVQDLSGVALPGVSKYAYSLGADLSRPFVKGEVYLHADWLYRSSFNSTPTNSIYGVIPAYGLLNAKLGARIGEGRFDVSIWARNLLNEDYYISRGATNYGLITAAVGDPRTYGTTARVKF